MSVYPRQVTTAAKNLLDNEDFSVIVQTRLKELQHDVLYSDDKDDILKAHSAYSATRDFFEWIDMLASSK